MAIYRNNFMNFEVSDAWTDQSISAFRIPASPGQGDASFVVTHDPQRGGKSFADYAAEQQANCEKSLTGFKLIRAEAMSIFDRVMFWLEFTWKNNGKIVQIRQIQFDCDPLAVICTLTAAPADIPKLEDRWQALMGSIQFHAPPPAIFTPHEMP